MNEKLCCRLSRSYLEIVKNFLISAASKSKKLEIPSDAFGKIGEKLKKKGNKLTPFT